MWCYPFVYTHLLLVSHHLTFRIRQDTQPWTNLPEPTIRNVKRVYIVHIERKPIVAGILYLTFFLLGYD